MRSSPVVEAPACAPADAGLAAALTRMSTPPSVVTTSSTIARTDASSVVSATRGTTRVPCAASRAAASSSASLPRETTATSQPSAARAAATASPMPRLPPVTIARLPVNWRSMSPPHTRRGRAARPRSARQEPPDVLGLPEVPGVVVDHGDQPDPAGDRRVPVVVDHLVELLGRELRQQLD